MNYIFHICGRILKIHETMSFTIDTAPSPVTTSSNNGQSTSPAPSAKVEVTCDNLKELFEQVLTERQESTTNLTWVDDETVEVTTVSGQCMHQFALRAEELGKEVSYQKKVFITIKDK